MPKYFLLLLSLCLFLAALVFLQSAFSAGQQVDAKSIGFALEGLILCSAAGFFFRLFQKQLS